MGRILSFLHGLANPENWILINHQNFVFVIANCELVTLQRELRSESCLECDVFKSAKQEIFSSRSLGWKTVAILWPLLCPASMRSGKVVTGTRKAAFSWETFLAKAWRS